MQIILDTTETVSEVLGDKWVGLVPVRLFRLRHSAYPY